MRRRKPGRVSVVMGSMVVSGGSRRTKSEGLVVVAEE